MDGMRISFNGNGIVRWLVVTVAMALLVSCIRVMNIQEKGGSIAEYGPQEMDL